MSKTSKILVTVGAILALSFSMCSVAFATGGVPGGNNNNNDTNKTGGENNTATCKPEDQKAYPNLEFVSDEKMKAEATSTTKTTHKPAYCGKQYVTIGSEQVLYHVYGDNNGACATASIAATDANRCEGDSTNLTKIVQTIINTITYVIGIIAVIMIILGGISYATSQGDAAKVKKGKDTILYGIIGLVIAILAYAIINFVLQALS